MATMFGKRVILKWMNAKAFRATYATFTGCSEKAHIRDLATGLQWGKPGRKVWLNSCDHHGWSLCKFPDSKYSETCYRFVHEDEKGKKYLKLEGDDESDFRFVVKDDGDDPTINYNSKDRRSFYIKEGEKYNVIFSAFRRDVAVGIKGDHLYPTTDAALAADWDIATETQSQCDFQYTK